MGLMGLIGRLRSLSAGSDISAAPTKPGLCHQILGVAKSHDEARQQVEEALAAKRNTGA